MSLAQAISSSSTKVMALWAWLRAIKLAISARSACAQAETSIRGARDYPLPSARKSLIGRNAWAAGGAMFNFGAERVKPRLTHCVLFFKQTKAVTNDFAGRGVAARIDLLFDETLEMVTICGRTISRVAGNSFSTAAR